LHDGKKEFLKSNTKRATASFRSSQQKRPAKPALIYCCSPALHRAVSITNKRLPNGQLLIGSRADNFQIDAVDAI
jgi:hypothetical protein